SPKRSLTPCNQSGALWPSPIGEGLPIALEQIDKATPAAAGSSKQQQRLHRSAGIGVAALDTAQSHPRSA
ncbi:hypothetical protein ACFTZB_36145, partial [Rhodococcus sp. NPDC057014]|uniref:hypothetical protein n=1 Tax=Rhodococcus sp. NPDC057014 TaxID=3346000 RepID=UPI00362DF6BC